MGCPHRCKEGAYSNDGIAGEITIDNLKRKFCSFMSFTEVTRNQVL
jgi:hypothetical protein